MISRVFNRITAVLATLLFISCSVNVFAEETPVDESKFVPIIKLASSSTIEVNPGQTQEITLEVKNVGTGAASNFFVQSIPTDTDPFSVTVETLGGSNNIAIGTTKLLKLTITVNAGAEGKVYPLAIKYNYTNAYKANFSGEDTLNIKVKNPLLAANVYLYDFVIDPVSLKAGESGELSFKYMNKGSKTEDYVRFSLEDLEADKITVPTGVNSQIVSNVRPGYEENMTFKIKAANSIKNGTYPIKIMTTVKDAAGNEATAEQSYFVAVGGASELGNASVEVINTSSPTKTFAVGEAINISFELKNTSNVDAENILVKANTVEGDAVVPVSQSMFQTRTLKKGEAKKYSFSFTATSSAKTQNYPVSFTIEYDGTTETEGKPEKITFSQYFGINVSNPEKEEKEETDENKNIPKIIISSYNCEPTIVKAGEEFDLHMTFMNSHKDKAVKNVKVSLTVTDKDDAKGASIFSPVNASNTLYIDEISPKREESRVIRYYAIPDAQPQNYSINVNFEYEDVDGKQIAASEIVGINVSQPPSVETSEINMPEMVEMGTPVFVNFEIYNKGRVAINNLKIVIDADVQTENKTTWIGNVEAGSAETYDAQFFPSNTGQLEGKLVVSYDSTTGESFSEEKPFSIIINEPMPIDMGEFDEGMIAPEETGSSKKVIVTVVIVVLVILAAIGGLIGYRVYKKKKDNGEFYE